jgi:hypothetical protein
MIEWTAESGIQKAEVMAGAANPCLHPRRQLIAKDEHEEYVECLDCGAILESAELPAPPAEFPDSLSDA